ncbi:Pfkfb3, partial [Symbiodinium necroappetens]
ATVFLKGDVEGAEVDLLRGLDDEHWAWVCGLAIEAAETKDELIELCKQHGLEKLHALKQPSPEGDTSRTDTEVLHMVFAARE